MTNDELHTVQVLAELEREADPLTRYLEALSNDDCRTMRKHYDETVRLRRELEVNVREMLVASNMREAHMRASWVAEHAVEVAERWRLLMVAVRRFAEREVLPPIRAAR